MQKKIYPVLGPYNFVEQINTHNSNRRQEVIQATERTVVRQTEKGEIHVHHLYVPDHKLKIKPA